MGILRAVFFFLRGLLLSRSALAAENLALRQQVAVYKQSVKRPKLRLRDRVFWVWLSRLWSNWRSVLAIVQPETVIKWQRQGFKLYWRWKSRAGKPGRPPIKREIRDLIRRMSRENPTWGAPRILSELLLLGYDVAEGTVAKYMVHQRKPPSQTWRTFLANHVPDIAACDFFTVPTVTFRVLYVFIVLRHDRRQVIHFNVTEPSLRRMGRPADRRRLSRMRKPRVSFSGIATVSMANTSRNGSRTWALRKSRLLRVRLGKIPIAKESSVRYAAIVWTR